MQVLTSVNYTHKNKRKEEAPGWSHVGDTLLAYDNVGEFFSPQTRTSEARAIVLIIYSAVYMQNYDDVELHPRRSYALLICGSFAFGRILPSIILRPVHN